MIVLSKISKGTIIIIALFLIFSNTVNVFSFGQQEPKEDRLKQAEQLIEEKKYNEAMLLLGEVIREEPEKIYAAEKLLQKIRERKAQYNTNYEELINVLYEEGDVEKALGIIDRLEELDKSPNKATLEAVEYAKNSAEFVFFQKKFLEIMKEGQRLIQEEKYWKAVEVYTSGLGLNRESFEEADYGNIIKTKVFNALDTLKQTAKAFIEGKDRFQEITGQFKDIVAQKNPHIIVEQFDPFFQQMKHTMEQASTVLDTALTFEEQNRRIRLINEDNHEDFFLGYTMRIASGRKSVNQKEGISGAMNLIFEKTYNTVVEPLLSLAQGEFTQAQQKLIAQDWDQGKKKFDITKDLYSHIKQLSSLWQIKLALYSPATLVTEQKELIDTHLPTFLESQYYAALSLSSQELCTSMKEINSIVISESMQKPVLQQKRTETIHIASEITRYKDYWDEHYIHITGPISNYIKENLRQDIEKYHQILSSDLKIVHEKEINTVSIIAEKDYKTIEQNYAKVEEQFAYGNKLLNGIETTIETTEGEKEQITASYPEKSIEVLNKVRDNLSFHEEKVQEFLTVYQNEKEQIVSSGSIRQQLEKAKELKQKIQNRYTEIAGLIREAKQKIVLAKKLKNEGYEKIEEARTAVRRNDFYRARNRISLAREKFIESLMHKENSEFRKESDNLLLQLSQSITDAQNRLIIAEVRTLINKGREFYLQNEFIKAERVLLNAKTKWESTQTQENTEVEYWLGFVRAALFIKSSRDVKETDPLFFEMSQLLGLAKRDYRKARQYLEEEKTQQINSLLDRAEEKLLKVTIPFPYNKEASVLLLQIEKIRNRENFEKLFQKRFKEAQEKLSQNPQEAYVDLKDLEAIDPNYPGLQKAIYNAEIKLGIRVAAPDRSAIAKSKQLYEQAYTIYQRNVRSQFPIALEQLNRAIELDPNNQDAIALKDQLQIGVGGQTSVVISSVAEQQYRLAEEKFISGNYFEALSIVQKLMQNKKNQKYPPLIELKRRIESKI